MFLGCTADQRQLYHTGDEGAEGCVQARAEMSHGDQHLLVLTETGASHVLQHTVQADS